MASVTPPATAAGAKSASTGKAEAVRPVAKAFLATLPDVRPVLQTRDFTVVVEGGIAWMVIDMQGKSVNVMNQGFLQQWNQALEALEKLVHSKEAKVVVVTSGKFNTFVAGADITEMFPNTDPAWAEKGSQTLQVAMDRLAALSAPTIAAINGTALGGGLEIALACTFRVSADQSKTQLGLPEVKLGVIPGAGGTVRLPQLVGLQEALQIILPGGDVRPKKALTIGLVDAVFESDDRRPSEFRFYNAVRAFAVKKLGTSPYRPAWQPLWEGSVRDRLLNGTPAGRWFVARTAAQNLDKQTKGKYPAPYLALDSAVASFGLSMKQALAVEAKNFSRASTSPQSKALSALFFMTDDAKKYEKHIPDGKPVKVKQIGVIGAGVMGAQIAAIAASKGLRVYMRDIKEDFVKKGLKHVEDHFNDLVRRKRLTAERGKYHIGLVSGGVALEGFASCQVLIEAAIERMDLKKKILQECEAVTSESCIFATNTSSLSITDLASAGKRPQNVVGLHFFNPVSRMPLVEVIKGSQTAADAVATAYQLSLALGKIPMVCKDGPGFIVNRILGIYMNEAAKCLLEGTPVAAVDKALVDFGMPMGPFRVMDEVGLDVAAHVGPILEGGLGERFRQMPEYSKILTANPTTLGKKTGQGFYLYNDGKQTGINISLMEQLSRLVRPGAVAVSQRDIIDRCVLVMLNEACYILSEGIVARPADLDLAMVMGAGFAPFYGGLFSYADQRGITNLARRMQELQERYGARFQPHPLLQSMAAKNTRFYPERPDPSKLTSVHKLPRSKL